MSCSTRIRSWVTLFAVALVAGGLGYFARGERTLTPVPVALNVPEKKESPTMFPHWDKVHLDVTGPTEFEPGKPVEIEVTLHNDDATWQMIAYGGDTLKPLGISVYGGHAQICPTKRGNELLRPTSLGYTLDGPTVTTAPSSSRTWKVNLAECFDLPPGTYILIAAVDVDANDTVHRKEYSEAIRAGALIDGREIKSDAWMFEIK